MESRRRVRVWVLIRVEENGGSKANSWQLTGRRQTGFGWTRWWWWWRYLLDGLVRFRVRVLVVIPSFANRLPRRDTP